MLTTMLLACISSCSKDDEPKENGEPITSPAYVISKITDIDDYYENEVTELFYDSKGRFLYSTGAYFGWIDFDFLYKDDAIIIEDEEDGMEIKFEDGLIKGFWSAESGLYYRYYFNENKQLTAMGWTNESKFTLTWKDDKIIKIIDDDDIVNDVQYYSSLSIASSAAVIINSIIISELVEDEFCWILAQNGYCGKIPSTPISKIGNNEIVYGELDSNKCPKSVKFIDNDNSNTYDYKFEWIKI